MSEFDKIERWTHIPAVHLRDRYNGRWVWVNGSTSTWVRLLRTRVGVSFPAEGRVIHIVVLVDGKEVWHEVEDATAVFVADEGLMPAGVEETGWLGKSEQELRDAAENGDVV